MPAPDASLDEYLIAQGLVFRAEISLAAIIALTGVAYVGVTTGAEEVAILQRSYSSSEAIMAVDLFEATWSAGATAKILNRRLASSEVAPATVFQGVTPGTLGTAISGVVLRAGSTGLTANLSLTGDSSRLYLKANTSYVVRYSNLGAGVAAINNYFDFRKVLKGGSWDKVLPSM